ncbi:hypothetical protein TEA_003753 [Camellia sinensis var. sinensis]|uniref:SHSP domain-containing protein n=1 Tax=Camellia sinensis var. sinensis TaxID=542762 RepID=A0A4S4EJT2_CAMSN|nr:hypothetical protein TEA_003753 [Camellia sinensis var. sinensis]
MESQLVRRMNTIAGHFATAVADDIAAAAFHIFPLNCSSSLNSVIRRCDNRMHFARQGSSSQACFMRQASTSTEQVSSAQSCVYLNKSCGSANEGSSNAFEAPLFSRPIARMQQNYPNVRLEWSPRMDVAESGCNYILTVELSGVNINDIRVEINDQILTVVAKNSNQCWRVASSNDTYHKREISQGPYKVVWTLPSNLNKDGVSAEFVDVLRWEGFSVQVETEKIPQLKEVLMGILEEKYMRLKEGVRVVRRHFVWNQPAERFGMFHMIVHSVWLRRIKASFGNTHF